MIVQRESDGIEIVIDLDAQEWTRFIQRYGEHVLQRLCAMLLDSRLSFVDITAVLSVANGTVWRWNARIEPYIPVEYRVHRPRGPRVLGETVLLEVATGIDTIYVLVLRKAVTRFERKHGSMQAFFELLAEECQTFDAIGERYRLTKMRVSDYYQQYLAPLLPAKSGHDRMRVCTIARHKRKHYPSATLRVWRKARRKGIVVEPIFRKYRMLETSLLLNGKRCDVHCIKTVMLIARRGSRGVYAYVRLVVSRSALKEYDFLIVVYDIPAYPQLIFLVPVVDLQSTRPSGARRRSFCLPVEKKEPYRNHKSMIGWQYCDAWHLIPPL